MGKRIGTILALLIGMVGVCEAQVTPGTTSSKTLDGVGNKITSTVVGPSRGLDVNVIAGGGSSGVPYLDADAIANQTTTAIHGQTYMYNGVTWDRVRGTIAGGLQVNCVTGCAGGASTPTDAFANPITAGIQQTFNMVYNGATWDRLRGTIAGGVLTNISNASLAVTGTFFQATQPVSGTVAVSNAFLLDATFTTRINTLGQKTMVNSTPVVLASDQTVIPVSQSGTWNINNVSGTVSLPTGAATEATLATRLADATFTGRFVAAYVDADTIANQTTTAMHGQLYGYNGATWDRLRATIANGLAVDVTRVSGNVTVIQGTGTNLHVVCDSGCTPGGSFADNAAFTFGTTAINNMGAVVDDTATNVVTENSAGAPRMNTNRILYGMPTNLTGTALYPTAVVEADGIANPTLTQISTFIHGWNGATWDRLKSTTANGLVVDVSRVQGSVAVTNAGLTNIDVALSTRLADATFTGRFTAATLDADAIANETTTSVHGKCYLYNGATWDRCRGTTASGLLANVSNLFLLDATLTNRFPAGSTPANGESNAVTITRIGNYNYIFNGATWDRWTGAISGTVAVSNSFLLDATFTGRINTQGQKTMAASTPVVLPSDQAAIPVTLTSTTITGTVTVQGAKTNNNAAPGATNVGVLPCVATAVAPTYVEGNQVGCSTDLLGNERFTGTVIQTPQSGAIQTFISVSSSSVALLNVSTIRQTLIINNVATSALCVTFGITSSLNTCAVIVKAGQTWSPPDTVVYRGALSGRWFANGIGEAIITDIPGG